MDTTPEPRLVAYIDEAGCSGDKYGTGSSKFLVIGAAVFSLTDEPAILSLFEAARAERGHNKAFLKFSKNNEKDNFVLTKELAKHPVRITQVALHKPSMAGSHIRTNHQEEYQYLTKFAIERVSWIARDAARGRDPKWHTVKLIFSKQELYPYEDIAKYLNLLRDGRGKYNCSIEWDYIHETFTAQKHKDETGIHIADLTASSLHKALEQKQHDMTDDRFERNLMPILYRKHGRCFGIKLFPRKEIQSLLENGRLEFMKLVP